MTADPLDNFSDDEIRRAVGGERFASRLDLAIDRPATFCARCISFHAPSSAECREQQRLFAAETRRGGRARGIKSKHSHWERPPWQV